MTTSDGIRYDSGDCVNLRMEDLHVSEEDDDTDEESDTDSAFSINCLFCSTCFNCIYSVLRHLKTEHNINLSILKKKFHMDCYSYICMINFIRREKIQAEQLLSYKEAPWHNEKYLTPVMQDDPFLMFDFDGEELSEDSRSSTPEEQYHVVNSENGLVTLSEQHFAQLQQQIKQLSLEVQNKNDALSLAAEQIQKMKTVTQNIICNDSEDTKINFLEDSGYFGSYSRFGIHHEMLSDTIRTSKYRDAIINNSTLISGKTVLDIGCGTGILSMFAASAGASKVFGVDKSDIIFNAMDIIEENNFMKKIDLIHATVEEAKLPVEKVDIIISEWMGYFLLYEGMLDSVIAARKKYLKPDGYLMPNKCILYLVGLSDPGTYNELVNFWSDVYGFKMSSLTEDVLKEAQILQAQNDTLGTTPAAVFELNIYTAEVESTNFVSDFSLESLIDGNITALCGYFDVFFDLPNPEVLSTSPKSEKTHWKQTIFFLKMPIQVTKGSVITGQISCQRSVGDSRTLAITIKVADQKNEYFLL